MRAYDFILPTDKVSGAFEVALGREFGGYTSWRAEGAWHGPAGLEVEKVTVFRVAVPSATIYGYVGLLQFVLSYARAKGERALYFGLPDAPVIYQTGN